ncbi:acyl-CoA thioester hydrolase/BAAT C-terminal domain-containing protein [Alteribacter natronophilus]|uniref:acyl-CoA thioester hydrolase/BAAT C-terminal domain-containing protein n=1 Tax=Alteribacter natronophilus TaxID=2583810 RepID=UPI001485ED40|nr:acyl-CoA thioester hydrolase/BAAT C-terminal domain-containing protein [Alteribacter natronophilus]
MTCFLYPDIGRVDETIRFHMDGFSPGEKVTIEALWRDALEHPWHSAITVHADEEGKVQINGDSQEPDFRTLLRELKPASGDSDQSVLQRNTLAPFHITITILNEDGDMVAERVVTRMFREEHVQREEVDTPDCQGTFFFPENELALPAVIVLGGSEGGTYDETAALLASHGYGVLALGYFGYPPLPHDLHEIPLETVDRAVEWLSEQPNINGNEISCLGISKGGELALLAASQNSRIKAVIGEMPPSHVFQSHRQGLKSSSWTKDGEPIPFVPYSLSLGMRLEQLVTQWKNEAVSMRPVYERSLEKAKDASAAAIPVEKINGPILLISGKEDSLWPSGPMCESMMERLSGSSFPHEKRHVALEGAGHVITIPYLPAHQPSGRPFLTGGTEEANALGGEKAWTETVAFLDRHFSPSRAKIETVPMQRQQQTQ